MTNVTVDIEELARQGEPVLVEMHSDDFRVEVTVDARPWLAQASEKDLIKLSGIDYRGDYAADEIYHFLESRGDPDVARLSVYLDTRPTMGRDPVGFEVAGDETSILAWLETHRPAAWAAVVANSIERAFDIEEEALDDLVIDTASEMATEELNALDDEDARRDGDEILGNAETEASGINNQGVMAQLRWLLEKGVGRETIEEAIEAAVEMQDDPSTE